MENMKAFVRTSPQNDDVVLKDVAIPEIDKDEVLVKVEAFGVGIHDRYFIPTNGRFTYPIGIEAAGVIAKKGNGVSDFQNGDNVILSSSM